MFRILLILFFIAALARANAQVPATDIVLFDLIWNDRGRIELSNPVPVTDRDGYDNQPSFSPEGDYILYTSIRNEQADIYRYDIASGQTVAATTTPEESEYSPVVNAEGTAFSVVRVEDDDSTQRVWRFPVDGGKPRLLMDQIAPVGYYAWMEDGHIALFILGDGKQTLQICHSMKQRTFVVAPDIGRCLQKVPGENAVSFIAKRPGGKDKIRAYDNRTRRVTDIADALPESQDFAWTPDGKLLMGSGGRLYFFDPADDQRWHLGFDLETHLGRTGMSRMAVSPDGRKLAVVFERP